MFKLNLYYIACSSLLALSLACSSAEPSSTSSGGTTAGTEAGTTTAGTIMAGEVASMICASDLACPMNQVCVNGSCIAGQCNAERACPPNFTCDPASFTCVANTIDECMQDSDCDSNKRCEQNRCVTIGSCIDADQDGYGVNCPLGTDCDDGNAQINSGVVEDGNTLCDDGIDHNCDDVDPRCGVTDADGDGVTAAEGDCDDGNRNVNPSADEIYYNNIDDDCNPETRDQDQDHDGYAIGLDCNDMNAEISPVALEVPGNDIDEDCDGEARPLTNMDVDGDGVTDAMGDCNDDNPNISPNKPEIPYNSIDDDCDASTPDNDLDGDGHLYPSDCRDDNRLINPNADEIYYNGVDDDCNPETIDADADNDGYRALSEGGNDCNDDNAQVNVGIMEQPYNGLDDDCNPATPDDDVDGDGFERSIDCNDDNGLINPDADESTNPADGTCGNDVDENCDDIILECDVNAIDSDNDGVPDDLDCEPNNEDIPGALEIPNNGLDDDCDPSTLDTLPDCINDTFDDNGSNNNPLSATAINDANSRGIQFGELIICPEESDWYQIVINSGDGIEVDITFDSEVSDIDAALYRLNNGQVSEGGLTLIDTSDSVNSLETLYARRASVGDTYFIKVYQYNNAVRQPYTLTTNVFDRCQDDLEGFTSEHNDQIEEAVSMPSSDVDRQICDFDDDWYSFTNPRTQNVRIDALFSHSGGDLDIELYNTSTNQLVRYPSDDGISTATSRSFDDDEIIEVPNLPQGDYKVRIYGVGNAQNSYRIFKSSGAIDTVRYQDGDDYEIPDAINETTPGVYTSEAVRFSNVPAGAIIRTLKVNNLDINHYCLSHIDVVLKWDGEDIVTLWSRNDTDDCYDDGNDDDGLSFGGLGCLEGVGATRFTRWLNDVCLLDNVYREFAGLDAEGELTLEVRDYIGEETGEVVNFDVEIEYFIP
jgi:hypothetical protein